MDDSANKHVTLAKWVKFDMLEEDVNSYQSQHANKVLHVKIQSRSCTSTCLFWYLCMISNLYMKIKDGRNTVLIF